MEVVWVPGVCPASLRDLPGGIRKFLPCDIGGNHERLRHGRLGGVGARFDLQGLGRPPPVRCLMSCYLWLGYRYFLETLLGFFTQGTASVVLGPGVPSWRLPAHGAVGGLVARGVGGFCTRGTSGDASVPALACVCLEELEAVV